jgi:hypothetical protein
VVDLHLQHPPSYPAGSAAAAAMQLQGEVCDAPGASLSIAEQGQLAQQQQQQQQHVTTRREARFKLAAGRLRGSWLASMVHLNQQREQAAQKLLQQSSEAKHAFNQSAHEMYNEVGPPLLSGLVGLIGNRNAADLVAFLGWSNTATVVGKLGSSSNTAVLQEIGPVGTARVVQQLGFLGVVDVVQKLGIVGGAKLGYKLGRELAGKAEGRLQGVVDDAKQQLQDSRDSSIDSSSNGSCASLHQLTAGTAEVEEPHNGYGSEAAGGWDGVRRQVGSVVRHVGGVVLLLVLRVVVAGWRFGAACVLNIRRAVQHRAGDGRGSRGPRALSQREQSELPQQVEDL